MSEKFQNKYRIPSARLQLWDYGRNAMYFVTICTKNRDCFFGNIDNGVMVLSELGGIVKNEWIKTFQLRPDMNLQMGEFVIMPNHFHAIITIDENEYNNKCRDAMHCVSKDTNNVTIKHENKFGPQSKNLASIIRGFKSSVTINARKIHADFAWQTRFHEHIVRNNESFYKISNYIINNTLQWENDMFYPVETQCIASLPKQCIASQIKPNDENQIVSSQNKLEN